MGLAFTKLVPRILDHMQSQFIDMYDHIERNVSQDVLALDCTEYPLHYEYAIR